MPKIEAEIITFFLAIVFAMLGLAHFLFTNEAYTPLWIASFIFLLATVGMDLINRIEFKQGD